MRRLRLVWQLHLEALRLLRGRLRALRERGPWVLLIIGLLFLPTLAVPVVWASNGKGLEYLLPWAIYLAAQIAVVLRHPFKPRKAVIHPLPVWYFWAVQALCAAGTVVLSWHSVWVPPHMTFDLSGTPKAPLEPQLAAFLLALVALTLVTIALPPLLTYSEELAERLGLCRWLRSAPNLYFLALLLGVASLITASSESAFDLAIALIPLIPAILLRQKLWSRDSGVLLAGLPQIGFWSLLVMVLLKDQLLGLKGERFAQLTLICFAAEYAASFYWLVLLLRVPPVESIDRPSFEDEPLSVQTDPTRYVDTSGHGSQLLAFIRRSDGGVLGLTGVRGAGKSALIAHLLSRLKKQHFVLSMTAPVRHDPGLGFLSAVCRAVCRRVLDDVHRALYGRKTEEGRARSEILRRARNLGVVAALTLLAGLALIKLTAIGQEAPEPEATQDLCTALRRIEIKMTDDLLSQVSEVLVKGEKPSEKAARTLHYQLMPSPYTSIPGFVVLAKVPWGKISIPNGEPRSMYKTVVGGDYHFQGPWPHELGEWTTGEAPGQLEDCHEGPLTGYSMQSLRQFFQSGAAVPPAQQPQGGAANPFKFAHPDWLSFLLIERRFTDSDSPLNFEQLRIFRSLLETYRNSFEQTLRSVSASEAELPLVQAVSALVKPAWIIFSLILVLLAGEPAWRALSSLARAVANWRFVALYREAQQFLELLNYSESLETKGSFSWKALSLEHSRSLAARDLTLPGLTARYVEFVQSVRRHYNGKVIIAIDELDKIHDPEMAKALLTEIKGALFTKGCYYLISISEDARRAFRQRLSSGRDIFESTFDDIVDIPQMTVEAASSMIERRLETSPEAARIPASCHFVLALAGGGIPREIVRHLRSISLAHEGDASGLQPGPVATAIFLFETQAWEAGLAEVELSGEDTIALRAQAKEILAILREDGFGRPACHRIWGHLEQCLDLIDPAKFRRSVVLFPNITTDDKDTPHAVLRYQAILDDLQSCLRLMILTTVCELAWQVGNAWREHESAILAAYRALADKPALAETLLGEIRATFGTSPTPG